VYAPTECSLSLGKGRAVTFWYVFNKLYLVYILCMDIVPLSPMHACCSCTPKRRLIWPKARHHKDRPEATSVTHLISSRYILYTNEALFL